MKIIVDTNIIFSAILNSQSSIGQILLCSDKSIKFYSPRYLQSEIKKHIKKIQKITKLSDSEVYELIEILYTRINYISEEFIPSETLVRAEDLTKDIDFDDALFVALTIHLRGKLWTGDKILMNKLKHKGFKRFVTTNELKERLKR